MSTRNFGAALSLAQHEDGVAVLTFDIPGESVNSLRADFADAFESVLTAIEQDASIRAVVVRSGKKSFIVGADAAMIDQVTSAQEAEQLARRGQEGFDRLEASKKPIIAAIHGEALGGGLELALACHGRVASAHPKTKLGLPEVQLGLLPGAGGTQRLPRLIGAQAALDLMLTGRHVGAKRAAKLGLVDEVVPEAILVETAIAHARRHLEGKAGKRKGGFDRDELLEMALADNPLGRKVLFDQAKKPVMKKTRGNYPAPLRILEVVKTGLEKGFAKGLAAEARAFGELAMTPESAALRSIFFAHTALKKDRGVDDDTVQARELRGVGVLGAGLMGAGIAYVTAAKAGLPVRLKDRDAEGVLGGMRHIQEILDKGVKRKKLRRPEADELMLRTTGTTSYAGFERVDIVIEAVFEDLALKQRVLREVEEHAGEEVIFASNTSSIPIARIAEASARPENVIGMHYFSPVPKMPLLEIIVTAQTAPEVTATCVKLGQAQGKTVIVVKDGPGFYTTRILAPYMNEAAHLLSEGVAIDRIDEALLDFGFPVGPLKLTDEVGIDVGAHVGEVMLEAFGARMQAPAGFERLIADDRKGRKNGRGFYDYSGKKKGVDESVYGVLGVKPKNTSVSKEDIQLRCTLMMVNEAARCMEEGLLRSPRDGDIGAIFGLGFPPFLGGPFRYVDALGAKTVVERLARYAGTCGERFAPAQILVDMAARGERFHP